MVHTVLQPSPFFVFPSSHCSDICGISDVVDSYRNNAVTTYFSAVAGGIKLGGTVPSTFNLTIT